MTLSLQKTELLAILESGRRQTDEQLTRLLDEAQRNAPLWYEAVYGPWSDTIAELSRPMAELFLDLACDILWVYSAVLGELPREEEQHTLDFLHELDLDLKAISGTSPMHPAFEERFRRRLEARALARDYPAPLLSYLEEEVQRFASFDRSRVAAVRVTGNLLSVLVAWLHEIYYLSRRSRTAGG